MSNLFVLPEKITDHIYRGDTIQIDAAVSQEGVAVVPLTDYLIWFTAKPEITNTDSATGVIQKTLTNGIVITDVDKGWIRITIAPADTAQISADTTYQCDLQLKHIASGEISTIGRGTMKVERDVTQATAIP